LIEFSNISLDQGNFSLHQVSFKIEKGQYAVLMGETGCGKTSLLEVLAGLKEVTSGTILLNGSDMTHARPAARGLGYVPQEGSLFASMTVSDNMAFALDVRKWKKEDQKARVQELSSMLGIEHLLNRSILGLSGGERQRVALGRALAFRPEVLLLDEPLSAVDENTRQSLCQLLKSIQKETGVTVLHVTHSPWEAEELGDVILRLHAGKIDKQEKVKGN